MTTDEAVRLTKWATYLLEQRNYSAALEAFEKATELDPTDAIAWQGKGRALYSLEKDQEALKAIETAMELEPNNAIPCFVRAESYIT